MDIINSFSKYSIHDNSTSILHVLGWIMIAFASRCQQQFLENDLTTDFPWRSSWRSFTANKRMNVKNKSKLFEDIHWRSHYNWNSPHRVWGLCIFCFCFYTLLTKTRFICFALVFPVVIRSKFRPDWTDLYIYTNWHLGTFLYPSCFGCIWFNRDIRNAEIHLTVWDWAVMFSK